MELDVILQISISIIGIGTGIPVPILVVWKYCNSTSIFFSYVLNRWANSCYVDICWCSWQYTYFYRRIFIMITEQEYKNLSIKEFIKAGLKVQKLEIQKGFLLHLVAEKC